MWTTCRQQFLLMSYLILTLDVSYAVYGCPCSFSASSGSEINLVEKGTVVVFGSTYLNENNCYNASTGVFSPQTDGVYHFQWKIAVHSKKSSAVRFLVNDKKSAPDVYVNSIGKNHNSVTSFAVVRLKAGDNVSLVSNKGKTFIAPHHSGFGGFCVSE